MIVGTFFKVVEVSLISGESSLFRSRVNVRKFGTNGIFR